jgi:DNA-binding PadR family transcriptional regulator
MKLPSQTEFELLELLARERPVRDLAKAFEKSTGRAISYGTIHPTLMRMRKQGWVSATDSRDADGPMRSYRITGLGVDAFNMARERFRALGARRLIQGEEAQ